MDQFTFLVAQGVVWLVVSFAGTLGALWVWYRPGKHKWASWRTR